MAAECFVQDVTDATDSDGDGSSVLAAECFVLDVTGRDGRDRF